MIESSDHDLLQGCQIDLDQLELATRPPSPEPFLCWKTILPGSIPHFVLHSTNKTRHSVVGITGTGGLKEFVHRRVTESISGRHERTPRSGAEHRSDPTTNRRSSVGRPNRMNRTTPRVYMRLCARAANAELSGGIGDAIAACRGWF